MSSFVTQEMVNAYLSAAHPSWKDGLRWLWHEKRALAGLTALSAMPLASRLALARALVPGWAVVPREATEAMETACIKASLAFLIAHKIKAIWPWSRNRSHVRENIRVCYRAMVRAVEVPE